MSLSGCGLKAWCYPGSLGVGLGKALIWFGGLVLLLGGGSRVAKGVRLRT